MPAEFVPRPPAGFEIAGTFNGVTTAVGPGEVPRIRYQLTGVRFPSGGLVGFAMRQVLKTGVGDEVALGGLHSRLSFALMMVGDQPESGVVERLGDRSPNGFALGRYRGRPSGDTKFGGMALLKAAPGMVEILVTECDTEERARELINAAMAPYL